MKAANVDTAQQPDCYPQITITFSLRLSHDLH
jgi:hypothetical protein